MEKPLEMDKKKYSYEIFMKRIVGQELYYQLDKEKTVLENLKGKILLEFPEFIIATNETAQVKFKKISVSDCISVLQRKVNDSFGLR